MIPTDARIAKRILIVLLTALCVCGARAEQPKAKVLNIEAAMRAWQDRYRMISPFSAYWYERSDAVEPGLYPPDCFYAADLLLPAKAAELVDNLYREMEFNLTTFMKTPADGNLLSPLQLTTHTLFNVPRPTISNYEAVFAQLVDILSKLNVSFKTAASAGNLPVRNRATPALPGIDCEAAKSQAISQWNTLGVNQGTSALVRRLESLTVDESGYRGLVQATKGSFSYDLSRFNGTARHATRIEVVRNGTRETFGTYIYDEAVTTGVAWTSQLFGWGPGDITAMQVDCPAIGQGKTLELFVHGLVVIKPQFTHNITPGQLWTECETCAACKDRCEAGAIAYANESISVTIPLGGGIDGTAGTLQLKAETPSNALATPWGLNLKLGKGAQALFDFSALNAANLPRPRQILAPQSLLDVQLIDSFSYELRFYAPTQVGPKDASGFYTVTGAPFRTVAVENPDRSATVFNRLKLTTAQNGTSDVATYTYNAAASGWTLVRQLGSLTQTDSRSSTFDVPNSRRTEIHQIVDEAARVVLHERNVYQVFPWNSVPHAAKPEELIESTVDPNGAALTTTYEYYTQGGTDGYGCIKQQVSPSGFWQKFDYDSSGRVIRTTTPFGDALPGATEGVRTRTITRSTSAPHETEIESLVLIGGTQVELGRTYRTFNPNETIVAVCQTPGAAVNASDNLVTTTINYDSGEFWGKIARERRPDGTETFYAYQANANGSVTTTISAGKPNVAGDGIADGTRTVSTVSKAGELIEESLYDVSSNLLLRYKLATQTDAAGRVTRYDYPDGTFEARSYACCGLEYSIDRQGVRTDFSYDVFRRLEIETKAGVAKRYTYDGAGRRLTATRVGTDNSTIVTESNVYDVAGRLGSTTAAGNRTTTFSEVFNLASQRIKTTTLPGGGTRIETYARDGSLLSLTGTAAAPRQYQYGTEPDGYFVKEISVGSGGETTEWTKRFTDFAGREWKIVLADGANQRSYFNLVGQLVRQVDPDGITTLFAYNARGEQETAALDLNGNATIDFSGTDRITKTTTTVATKTDGAANYVVQRSTTQVWETDNADTPVTVSIAEQTGDGLRSWQTVRGLTTKTVTVLDGSGGRTTTTTTPDGVKTIQVYATDRLVSTTIKTAADVQLSAVTYAYDPHGRMSSATDARNGATTFTYFADDQVNSVTTPDPDTTKTGPGYDPQVTAYSYDSAGRVQTVTQPDGGVVTTTYWPTGAVKRTSGSRTYPVEYTYDAQGRVKTLTTWQNYAGDSGKAVTVWNYDAARGWLNNKRHADNTGPTYTYKPSGRLLTRIWARTPVITTTYSYNAAGDLALTDYSDATPDVTLTYDRAGRPKTLADGAGNRSLAYHSSGQLEDETYTAGLLNGHKIDRSFDSLHRPSGTVALNPQNAALIAATYAYDTASRLDTVTAGTLTATYAYLANSPLVASLTLRHAGAVRLTTTKVYDKLNRLESISNQPSAAGLPAVAYAYTYNAANQRTRVTHANAAYWSFAYDELGQVTSGKKFLGDATAVPGHDYAWTYDDIGNRKTAAANGNTATYTASSLNQYSQRTVPGAIDVLGAAAATATVTVALNNGTPQSTTRQGELFHRQLAVPNASAAQNASLKLTGVRNLAGPAGEDVVAEITTTAFVPQTPEVFTHDADGNLTADARWAYAWDAENRLVALETTASAAAVGVARRKLEFAYDGQSRRLGKKSFTWTGAAWSLTTHTLFVYDGWNLIAELDALAANALVRSHTWGLDLSGSFQGAGGVGGLLTVADGGTTPSPRFAAFDGNGNVAALVAAADGTLAAHYDYNAFGETVLSEGPSAAANPFGFSTKFADAETGHLYYGFRCYHPQVGRWLSRDPYEEEGGANLYGFVENAPTEWIDPLGLALYAFDGTNNDGVRDEPKGNETNVFVLWKSYTGNRWYIPGVGTNDGVLNPIGSAFGAGGQRRERSMLAKAEEFVQKGDMVADIMGFSRGAAQARDFANRLKEKHPCVTIRWIGLFDTVASEGLPNDVNIGYRLGIPSDTGSVLHLTAGAERRRKTFALTSIRPGPNLPNLNPNFREEEIADAVHSDVGGFYGKNRGLANQALQRMWRHGLANGVPFGPLPVRYTNVTPTGPNDSRWLNDKAVEFFTGRKRVRKIYYHP